MGRNAHRRRSLRDAQRERLGREVRSSVQERAGSRVTTAIQSLVGSDKVPAPTSTKRSKMDAMAVLAAAAMWGAVRK